MEPNQIINAFRIWKFSTGVTMNGLSTNNDLKSQGDMQLSHTCFYMPKPEVYCFLLYLIRIVCLEYKKSSFCVSSFDSFVNTRGNLQFL